MLIGMLCIAGASLLFGLIPTINKYVLLSGMVPECVTFFAHGVVVIGAVLLSVCKKRRIQIPFKQAVRLLLLGAIGMGATSFFVNKAAETVPVGVVTVLHFLYPTIVSLAMVVFFHQKMTSLKALAMFLSVCGMLLLTNSSSNGEVGQAGIFFALLSSLTYACYIVCNDQGSVNELPLSVKLIYTALGSTTVFGLLSLRNEAVRLPQSSTALLALVLGSGVGSLLAFYFITAGVQRVGASTAAFTNMLEPIVSVVVSTIVYQDMPTPYMMLGMCLILVTVFLSALDGKNTAANRKDAK